MLGLFWHLRQGASSSCCSLILSDHASFQIYAQAADNASNNDTMIRALGHRLNGPAGPHTRIRCFCHILNLCVKVRNLYSSQHAPD